MATAQIVLKILPDFDKNKLDAILTSLKNLLSQAGAGVDIINPDKLRAALQQAFGQVGQLQNGLNGIDVSELAAELDKIFNSPEVQKFTDDILSAVQAIEDGFGDLDDAGLQKLAGGMANAFRTGKAGAAEMASVQRDAMAQLVLSGKKGTDEYKQLVESMKKAEAETEKYEQALKDVEKELGKVGDAGEQSGKKASSSFGGNSTFQFNQFSQNLTNVAQSMSEVINVGAEFQSNVAALGAITGASGAQLDDLADRARNLAKEFGGSATSQLKSFQGILSKLGPDVANDSAALELLGKNVNILSAASGDDAATSMNAITDSLLQMGLASGTPAEIAANSTRVINAMAASAKVGAAEVPQVTAALLQTGVAAKGANLDLEATNAAIQVLAVGGKTGSEAGVALRNVLGLLQKASGPAEEAMQKMGTSSKELGEILTTQGLDAALNKLQGGMDGLGSAAEKNAALITIFGTENSAAAGILLENVDKFKEFEDGIRAGEQGQGAAFEQAAQRMDTVTVKLSKIKAQVEDAFIGTFKGLGDGISTAIGATAQIAPQLTALSGVKQLIPESAISKTKDAIASLSGKLGGLSGAASKLGPALMNPYVLGTAAAAGALTFFFTQTKAGQKLWKELEETATDLFKKLEPLITKGADILGTWWEVLLEIGKVVWEVIITPFEMGAELIGAIIEVLEGLGGSAGKSAGTIDMLSAAMDKLKSFLEGMRDAIGGFTTGLQGGKEVLLAFIGGSADILKAFAELATTALNPANWFDGDLSAAEDKLKNAIGKTVGGAVDKANKEVAKAKLGEALEQAATIKGDLDKNGKLDQLVKKFENAKTDVEKQDIAKQIEASVPGAVTAIGAVVDAQGNVIKQYEVSGEAVTKFAKAQETALTGKAADAGKDIVEGLKAQADAVVDLQRKANDMRDEIVKKAAEGQDTTDLQQRYKELLTTIETQTKDVQTNVAEASKLGGETASQAFDVMAKTVGISKEQAKKATEQTVKIGDAAKKASGEVGDLAGAFDKAKKAADEAVSAGVAAINNNKKALADAIKAGNKDEEKRLREANAKLIADTRKTVTEQKNLAKTAEQTNIQLGLSEAKGESIYEKAKQIFEAKSKTLDLDEKTAEVAQSTKLLEENRERTAFDDLILQETKLKTLKAQQQTYADTLSKFVEFKNGQLELKAGIKLKTEEKAEVQAKIADFNLSIQQQANAIQEVKLKIAVDEKEVAKQLKELEFQKLEVQIELGLKTNGDITPLLEAEKNEILAQRTALEQQLLQLQLKFADESAATISKEKLAVLETQFKAEYLQIQKQLIETEKLDAESAAKIRKNLQDIRDKQLDDLEKHGDAELKLVEQNAEKTAEMAIALIQAASAARARATEESHNDTLSAIDREEQDKIDKIEEWNKLGAISEEEAALRKEQIAKESQARKEAAEEEHRKKMLALQAQADGAEKFTEAAKQKELLSKQISTIEEKLKIEKAYRDSLLAQGINDKAAEENVAKTEKELADVRNLMDTKGSEIGVLSTELQTTVTDSITNLFAGDPEAVADNFRKLFAVIAGALQAKISAFVLDLVLSPGVSTYLAALPFPLNALAIPAVTATINAAVKAITNPLLEGLLSFPTGGRIDQPTLAIVGDAARLGESNREWIFRDTQLRQVVMQAATMSTGNVETEIRLLRQDIQEFEGRLRVVASDVRNETRRLDSRLASRGR